MKFSAKATDEYEMARKKIADFINSPSDRDVVFTRNASEAINLVAYTWGLTNLKEGDEVSPILFLFCIKTGGLHRDMGLSDQGFYLNDNQLVFL